MKTILKSRVGITAHKTLKKVNNFGAAAINVTNRWKGRRCELGWKIVYDFRLLSLKCGMGNFEVVVSKVRHNNCL